MEPFSKPSLAVTEYFPVPASATTSTSFISVLLPSVLSGDVIFVSFNAAFTSSVLTFFLSTVSVVT